MSASISARLWAAVALVSLLLVAFALRLHRLDAVALRGDEAFTAVHWTKPPFSPDWNFMIRYEPNPGAMLVYWLWSGLVGTGEFALRMLPVLANVTGLAVGVALARRLGFAYGAVLAVGLLWALNPFFLWHAQDARQYSLLTALTPLNFYLLLRAVENASRRRWWVYAVFQTATLYLYYIEVFWVIAQGVYLLTLRRGEVLRRFLGVWIGIAFAAIPLVGQFYVVLSVSGYSGTAQRAVLSEVFSVFLPTLLFGESAVPLLLGVIAVAALVGALVRGRQWLLLLWVIVPTVLFVAASTQIDLFRPRYIIAVAPALILALAWVIWRWLPSVRLRGGLVAVLAVVCLVQAYAYYYLMPPKSPDWHTLTRYLRERTTTRSLIISDSADTALEYYDTAPGTVYFLPVEGDPTEVDFASLLATHDALFVLSGARTGEIAQFLQANAQAIPGDTQPGVSQFRPWAVTPDEIVHPLAVQFGDVAILRGYTLVGQTTLLLYWEALRTTAVEYSVLLHLENDPNAPPAAVLDHGIAGAIVSTRAWTPGVIYRDPVALPPDLLSGDLVMRVGLYDTATTEPLTVLDSDETRYLLGTLERDP